MPDDLTVNAAINNNEDRNKFWNELNELVNWVNKWQLKINYDKFHVIHIGNYNLYFDFNLDMHNALLWVNMKKCWEFILMKNYRSRNMLMNVIS